MVLHVFPLLPKEAFFGPREGTALDSSSKQFNMSTSDPLWVEFSRIIKELKSKTEIEIDGKMVPIKYGKDVCVKSSEIWALRSFYGNLSTPAKIRAAIKDGTLEEFNEKVGKIHKALWKRRHTARGKKKDTVTARAQYLRITGSDTTNWHKLGAKVLG